MEVREAVVSAKQHVVELFGDENIVNIGLEEVVFDEDADKWKITIGFSRPWDRKNPLATTFTEAGRSDRSYKVLCINDADGKVESVKDRILEMKTA